MITVPVSLASIDAVKKFVGVANKYSFDIELISGKYTINAKSIMGIFSLELSKTLTMQADCTEDSPLAAEIEPFVVKE